MVIRIATNINMILSGVFFFFQCYPFADTPHAGTRLLNFNKNKGLNNTTFRPFVLTKKNPSHCLS